VANLALRAQTVVFAGAAFRRQGTPKNLQCALSGSDFQVVRRSRSLCPPSGARVVLAPGRLHRTGGALLCAAILLSALAACRGQEAPPAAAHPVATVTGERIELGEFEKRLAEEAALAKGEAPLKAAQYARLKEEVLGRLVEERIMFQRARELLITVGEAELDARIEEIRKDYANGSFNTLFGNDAISYPAWKEALRRRMLLEKVVALDVNAKVQVTEAEAEIYYKANRKLYAADRRVRAAQIVVRDRDRAEAILKRLKAGEEFDKVAREVSIGPEAARGGDLGFFEQGVMPEAIDRMVFSLPVGKVSGVVQSPYGFHIFKVLGRQEGGGRRFAEATERVIADLRKLKEAAAYERWLDGLKERASIVIHRPLPDGSVPAGTGGAAPGNGRH
jgi:parvulin-like peptidyl-prolyl isomerase